MLTRIMTQQRLGARLLWPVLLTALLAVAHSQALPEELESYADFASRVVPAKLRAALDLLPSLNSSSGPGQVKPLRIALLEAREHLDIFSYAFPNSSFEPEPLTDATVSTAWGRVKRVIGKVIRAVWDWMRGGGASAGQRGLYLHSFAMLDGTEQRQDVGGRGERDLWHDVRVDLDAGYELLGDFQDLDHSLVEYNDTDVARKRAACLEWQAGMASNSARHHYLGFVSRAVEPGALYTHRHGSRLFWGYNGVVPDTALPGLDNLVWLVRDSQLARLLDTYPGVLALGADDLLEDPGHSTFHDFRKLVRSILAVLGAFPELLPSTSSPNGLTSDAIARGRSAASRRLLAYPQQLQTAQGGRVGEGNGGRGGADGGSVQPCNPSNVVKAFGQLFHDMGQTNNKIFAYQFYAARGPQWAEQAEEAAREVAAGWQDNVGWMTRVQVDSLARCLAAALPSAQPAGRA